MKNLFLLLFLLNNCALKVSQEMPLTQIEGIYEVTKITYAKQEIPSSTYQPMIVIALEKDHKGIMTLNTNKVMVKASSTTSVSCEFIPNGNTFNIYDLEKKAIIGTISMNKLHLFETKKNFESEMFASKISSLE
jgi:hypothetical protein